MTPSRAEGVRPSIVLGGPGRIGIADLLAVARDAAPVRLDEGVAPRLARAHAVIEGAVAGGEVVYGLTTGLGAAVDTRLSAADRADFQRRAVIARAVGVGDLLPAEQVRASLFARVAGLAVGASGIAPALADAIVAMLNRGVQPVARDMGSIGEADLAPLAEMFLPFVGAGEAWFEGELFPGPDALRRAGIAVPVLGAKDGVALFNASAFTVGTAALAQHDLRIALEAATVAGALSLEAFRSNLSPLDPRLVRLRPAPGQARGADILRRLLEGSDLLGPGQKRRVQDPLSFRCIAPVHGLALDRLDDAADAIEVDLNGAGDSPAVLAESGEMLSSANFDTTAIALSLEALGLAAAHVAALSTFRILQLMSPAVSALPRFLAVQGGSHSGFAPAQKTAAALEAEIRHLSRPIGPMTAPVADGIEDYAPMTPRIVAKTHAIARHLARLGAIELTIAAAAFDLRQGARLGRATRDAHRRVRETVPPFAEDRPTGRDFEGLAERIVAGAFPLPVLAPAEVVR